jgi:hypothetical protein
VKVVLVKTMLDKIVDAKYEAEKQLQKIEFIEITRAEARELFKELTPLMSMSRRTLTASFDDMRYNLPEVQMHNAVIEGIKIKVEGQDGK